jgi:large subunit ribosomal protein L23
MIKMDLYNVLISPLITEKSNIVAEKQEQVVFKVLKSATKADIKAAFELAFNAKVEKVSLLNVKGKTKRFGKFSGKRADWKKAYICLTPGQNFDLASNQK